LIIVPVLEGPVPMQVLTPDKLDSTLIEVVSRLRREFSPLAIIFFGSYVYGTPGRHSDLDLLVVVDHSSVPPHRRDAAAYRALGDIPFPIDVQVYTRDEFEKRAALPTSFERTVKNKGRLLYAA
jgi:predicted nucleotidyltransferase